MSSLASFLAVLTLALCAIGTARGAEQLPLHFSTEAPSYILLPNPSGNGGKLKVEFPWVNRKGFNSTSRVLDGATAAVIHAMLRDEGEEASFAEVPGAGTVPLHGNIIRKGEYFVDVAVGPQHFFAQVDTGSSDFAVPAGSCGPSCGNPPHTPLSTRNLQPTPCSAFSGCRCSDSGQCMYSLHYLDGTGFHAELYNAYVSFPPSSVAGNASTGAIVKEFNGFATPGVDGIIGFGYRSVSEINAPPVFASIVAATGLRNVFAMCFNRESKGGSMTLGGYPAAAGEYTWAAITDDSYYVVDVRDVKVDGKSIGVPPIVYNKGEAIVDSGTTLFYLPADAYKAFRKHVEGLCGSKHLVGVCDQPRGESIFDNYCFDMTAQEIAAYPTVTVTLRSPDNGVVEVPLKPEYYLLRDAGGSSSYLCMNIESIDNSDGTILGDVFMHAYTTVFDRETNQVGFGPLSCQCSHLLCDQACTAVH